MIESPQLAGFTASTRTVPLPTGRRIDLADVRYDTAADVFLYGNYDVTDSLGEFQKQAFPTYYEWAVQYGVELSDDNTRAQGRDPVALGSTTAAGAFLEGVKSDVLSLTQNIRDFAGIGPENAGKMSGVQKLVIAAVILGGLFLVWKIAIAVKEARA